MANIKNYKEKEKEIYKIFLCKNQIIPKSPKFKFTTYEKAIKKYENIIKECSGNNIIFPVKHITDSYGHKPVKFHVILVGVDGQILKYNNIQKEEKFYAYIAKKKITTVEILSEILPTFKSMAVKIHLFKNKIIIDDMKNIECILTKNEKDAERLYSFLRKTLTKKKIFHFMFLGKIKNSEEKRHYIEKLTKLTGLSHYQFRRKYTGA
jgi:hypothetical protein